MSRFPSAKEPWKERLYLPNYQVKDAARYSGISSQTIGRWHGRGQHSQLSIKQKRTSLSYLQLIEVAVVAAFRRAGVTLRNISGMREYAKKQFGFDFPFASLKFRTDGKSLFLAYRAIEPIEGEGKLLENGGQFSWEAILEMRLREFEYLDNLVSQWKVGGENSKVVINPRIAFGAPSVDGVATWVVNDRRQAGYSIEEIAEDLLIDSVAVNDAIRFEDFNKGPVKH